MLFVPNKCMLYMYLHQQQIKRKKSNVLHILYFHSLSSAVAFRDFHIKVVL